MGGEGRAGLRGTRAMGRLGEGEGVWRRGREAAVCQALLRVLAFVPVQGHEIGGRGHDAWAFQRDQVTMIGSSSCPLSVRWERRGDGALINDVG